MAAQDWLYQPGGDDSDEFVRISEIVAELMAGDQAVMAKNPQGTARLIVSNLAHRQNYVPAGFEIGTRQFNWTVDQTLNRSNSSETYNRCVQTVEKMIRANYLEALREPGKSVARLIVLALALEHGLEPPAVTA